MKIDWLRQRADLLEKRLDNPVQKKDWNNRHEPDDNAPKKDWAKGRTHTATSHPKKDWG